jgi:hypothetical protein
MEDEFDHSAYARPSAGPRRFPLREEALARLHAAVASQEPLAPILKEIPDHE